MSLFDELQWEIIEKPTNTNYYHRILNEQKKEKKTEKQKRKEMREKLWPVEYKKRYDKQRYQKQKAKFKKRYEEHRDAFNEEMLNDIINEIRWDVPDVVNRDKYYLEKFRDDDVKSNWYRFSWWSSRLARIKWKDLPKQKTPFRVVKVRWMERGIKDMNDIQSKAYQYLKPYMGKFKDVPLSLQKKQQPYDYPIYVTTNEFRKFVEWGPVNPWHIYLVFDAMRRWKYMVTETYLWRNSFIFGDVLVTQTWKLFRIALENNLPWLTKDTVEDIHSLRMDWRKNKGEKAPPIYIVNDAYLIKIKINEREDLFYIVPT